MRIGFAIIVLAALIIVLPVLIGLAVLAILFLPVTLVIAGVVLAYYGRIDLGLICIAVGIVLAAIGLIGGNSRRPPLPSPRGGAK